MLGQPRLRLGTRVPGALHDRVDGAGRKLDTEQLARELGAVATGDAVSDRERGDRCLQPRPERAPCNLGGTLGARLPPAVRASEPVQAVLADDDRDRRQLGDLVSLWRGSVDPLHGSERPRARLAAHRPMVATSSSRSGDSNRRLRPSWPPWPPGLRPEPCWRGRGGAEGGSCEGGSEEFRELRLSRRSNSATRASSRRFASTSSPTRTSSAIAVSRSPSRIASASARSTTPEFAEQGQDPPYSQITKPLIFAARPAIPPAHHTGSRGLNAYQKSLISSDIRTATGRRRPATRPRLFQGEVG